MYKGEPLFYYLNLTGIFSFLLIGIVGLTAMSPQKYLSYTAIISLHYYLVFFVGIGFLILGSTLQFYKAITAQKTYPTSQLKYSFILFLLVGTSILLIGALAQYAPLLKIGAVLYLIAVCIHFYWIASLHGHKYFKFPLNYYYYAQIFQIIGIILLLFDISDKVVTHFFTLGWITLTLQGALIRIVPMFMGKTIDRQLKPLLSKHLIVSIFSSSILLSGISFNFVPGYIIGGMLYLLSWLWVIYLLVKSIANPFRKTLHKSELVYFIPGIFWLLFGTFQYNIKSVHVHMTLFAGLFMIMIGAAHRILVFQAHSMAFTGRKTVVRESRFMHERQKLIAGILLNIATLSIVGGFYAKEMHANFLYLFIIGSISAAVGLGIIYQILISNEVTIKREETKAATMLN